MNTTTKTKTNRKINHPTLNSTVALTAGENAMNANRQQNGFPLYIKVACQKKGCCKVSPFRTQDELAVSRWSVYAGEKGVRCPEHA